VDRSYEFYVDKLGFTLDTDHRAGDAFRVVQVTPPGSACSIIFGKGMGDGVPGTLKGCQLVVEDIEAAHKHLEAAGIEAPVCHSGEGGVMTPGPEPTRADYGSFIFFDDPDGNTWAVQEIKQHVR
jgi:catechol 2,3-dioxygenase-like lactoylglutathione lyase family enzyme